MKIEIRQAHNIRDAEALSELDKKMFLPSDCFDDPDLWKEYECFWIVIEGKTAGSIAMGRDMEFSGSWGEDKPSPGCVYLASTGLLPEFCRRGIGNVVKQWEIDWARSHGFRRISTHCRKSNAASLRYNQKFGFKIIGEVADYYKDPDEPTIVMELRLTRWNSFKISCRRFMRRFSPRRRGTAFFIFFWSIGSHFGCRIR